MKYSIIAMVIFVASCSSCAEQQEAGRIKNQLGIPVRPALYPVTVGTNDVSVKYDLIDAVAWWNNEVNLIFIEYVERFPDVEVMEVPFEPDVEYDGRAYYTVSVRGIIVDSHIELMYGEWTKSPCVIRHEIGHILGLDHDDRMEPASVMTTPCATDSYVTPYDAELIIKDYERK